MNTFRLSAFFPLAGGHTFVLVLLVTVEQGLAWVREHADEIASRAAADDRIARNLNSGQAVALWVEPA